MIKKILLLNVKKWKNIYIKSSAISEIFSIIR